ncbi:MAG TPA: hypothetical protein VI168_19155 [Croceibacterium sp.]
MSLERRDQLVEQIVETQPKLLAFVRDRGPGHVMLPGWEVLSYSFQKGFETLWDHARADSSGLLSQPVLSLWRQSVELALKAAILYIAGGINGKPGHNLAALFAQLLAAREELGFVDDDELTASVRAMIALVRSLDPFADRFRYPEAKDGTPFDGIDVNLDELFQAHWIIVTYCAGCEIEVEEMRGFHL